MPKLLCARAAADAAEERKIRKLAASRHAPGDWILRARMIARRWDGRRTTAIAAELGCHPQTVRERLARFNAEGLDGLGDRPGAGRQRAPDRGGARAHPRPGQRHPARQAAAPERGPAGRARRGGRRPLDAATRWPRRRRSAGSPSSAARSGASSWPQANAGGARAAGPSAGTPTSPQQGRHRRPLHCPASRGDGRLRRRARPGDPAHLPARARLVRRRPPHQGPAGVRPRAGEGLGLRGAARARRAGRDPAPRARATPRGPSTCWRRVAAANPQGEVRVVTANLASHKSPPVLAWLAEHPRLQQVFIPVGACWLPPAGGLVAAVPPRRPRRPVVRHRRGHHPGDDCGHQAAQQARHTVGLGPATQAPPPPSSAVGVPDLRNDALR